MFWFDVILDEPIRDIAKVMYFCIMTIDDLINGALKDRGGLLEGTDLFAVVGNAESQEMFILNLNDFMLENLEHFITGNNTGTMLLGIYITEEEARSCIESIREKKNTRQNLLFQKNGM